MSTKTKAEQVAENILATLAEHPDLAPLADREHPAIAGNDFLSDVAYKFRMSGRLTERQVDAVRKALTRHAEGDARRAERDAAKQALIDAGVVAPEGEKVTVKGEIVSAKIHMSKFGQSYKMIVKAPEGWTVWSTIPRVVLDMHDLDELQGRTVTFVATLQRSDRDATHAFAKRPSMCEVIA